MKDRITFLKNLFSILILAFICTSTTCEEPLPTQKIIIENSTKETMFARIYRLDTNDDDWGYTVGAYFHIKIKPKESNSFVIDIIETKDQQTQFLRFFILKQSTLDRYSGKIDELLEKNIYDSVFVYSLAELKAMNYRITYSED